MQTNNPKMTDKRSETPFLDLLEAEDERERLSLGMSPAEWITESWRRFADEWAWMRSGISREEWQRRKMLGEAVEAGNSPETIKDWPAGNVSLTAEVKRHFDRTPDVRAYMIDTLNRMHAIINYKEFLSRTAFGVFGPFVRSETETQREELRLFLSVVTILRPEHIKGVALRFQGSGPIDTFYTVAKGHYDGEFMHQVTQCQGDLDATKAKLEAAMEKLDKIKEVILGGTTSVNDTLTYISNIVIVKEEVISDA